MKKIPSLFVRDLSGGHGSEAPYTEVVTPGCEWVCAGEGVATRKFDGTAVLIGFIAPGNHIDGLWKRYDAKRGKPAPPDFVPCQDPDPITGHWPGWVPVRGETRENWQLHLAVRNTFLPGTEEPGTYELVGPTIQSNPEGWDCHYLVKHGEEELEDCPREFNALREWFRNKDIEGVVWHHPDGRMVKVTKQGFGLPRKP